MADVTILPDGITKNSGWATNGLTEIDEGIAAADGSLMSTTTDGEGEQFTLDFASPGLTDADTITQMDVIIRHQSGGASTASILRCNIDGLADVNTPNRTSLTNDTLNNSAWNVDRTAAQLDALQVVVTAVQGGMPTAEQFDVDAIEVLITYTPAAAGGGRLLLINPPGLDGGMGGGLSL